jgi:hypothetical protein
MPPLCVRSLSASGEMRGCSPARASLKYTRRARALGQTQEKDRWPGCLQRRSGVYRGGAMRNFREFHFYAVGGIAPSVHPGPFGSEFPGRWPRPME